MDDIERQLSGIGKAMVQMNLRLGRLSEQVERGSGAPKDEGPALNLVFDLIEAIQLTLTAPTPAPPWWARWLRQAPQRDLDGLRLTRDHALEQLRLVEIAPAPSSGPVDPRVHRVIDVIPTSDPAQDGAIAQVHRMGWARAGDPPITLRHAHVSVWRVQEPS